MWVEGYEVVDGKNFGFCLFGWDCFIRVNWLGDDYIKIVLCVRIISQCRCLMLGKIVLK